MYRVRYYGTGNNLINKFFDTLHEATVFCVYKIRCWDVFDFEKSDRTDITVKDK